MPCELKYAFLCLHEQQVWMRSKNLNNALFVIRISFTYLCISNKFELNQNVIGSSTIFIKTIFQNVFFLRF